MDMEQEARNFKFLLIAGTVFLMSGCYSWGEFEYALWGRTATADVTSARVEQYRQRYRTREKLVVKYSFAEEDGTARSESTDLPPSTPPPGGTFEIRYLPGREGRSRPVDEWNWLPVAVFVAALVACGFFVWEMHRRANRAPTWRGRSAR